MIDLKRIRRDFDEVLQGIEKRGKGDFGLLEIQELEVKRRELLYSYEEKKAEQNKKSKLIPQYKKEGKDVKKLLDELKVLSQQISDEEKEVKEIEESISEKLLYVPNVPHKDIPIGSDEADNVELRRWGTPRVFDFEPKAHWDLGEEKGILGSSS